MSWDGYRDNLLGSKFVNDVALCGIQDGSVWTASSNFQVNPAEAKALINAFTNPSSLMSNGIHLAGLRYIYLQSDDQQIQGKKGPAGVAIGRSKMCLIIGTYGENMQAGNARKVIDDMCDYLRNLNY